MYHSSSINKRRVKLPMLSDILNVFSVCPLSAQVSPFCLDQFLSLAFFWASLFCPLFSFVCAEEQVGVMALQPSSLSLYVLRFPFFCAWLLGVHLFVQTFCLSLVCVTVFRLFLLQDLKPGDVTGKRNLWENKSSSATKVTCYISAIIFFFLHSRLFENVSSC